MLCESRGNLQKLQGCMAFSAPHRDRNKKHNLIVHEGLWTKAVKEKTGKTIWNQMNCLKGQD